MRKLYILILFLLIPIAHADSINILEFELRSLYTNQGILAGANQFSDYWARDSFFASLGSNRIGDSEVSKNQLELFILYQKLDGQIPLRIGSPMLPLKMIGVKVPGQVATYHEDKLFGTTVDQNCLFVIAAADYIKTSGDTNFAEENFNSFDEAINWLATRDKDRDLLIDEGYYAGWGDSLKRNGEILYTNVCYQKALSDMAEISQSLNKTKKYIYYNTKSAIIKNKLNEEFWNGNYYSDWPGEGYFSTDGNVLAIVWDVANKDQAIKIQNTMKLRGINNGFGVDTNDPRYSFWDISLINYIVQLRDYHDGLRWMWLSCFDALAKDKAGLKLEADLEFEELKNKINEYGAVYEVYEVDGNPVDRILWNAEQPFAWSSGVCLYVFSELDKL